jgi:hypothetical protein
MTDFEDPANAEESTPTGANSPAEKPVATTPVGSSGPSRTEKALEDLAKNYRDQFSASAARTGTTLLSWGAALIVLLINPIIPLIHNTNHLARLANLIVEGHIDLANDAEAKGPHNVERTSSIRLKSLQIDVNEQTYAAEFKKNEKIKTPLGDLELPAAFIPPLYSVLLAGFVIYLLQRRIVLNAMALRVIHLHIDALQRPASEIRGFGAWAPFWLAPLPRLATDSTSATDVADAKMARLDFLGWRESFRRKTMWFALMIAVIAFTWIRVILLARQIDLMQHGRPFILLRWETHALLFLVVCVLCFLYIRPTSVWGTFPEHLTQESPSRRVFLTATLLGIVAFVAAGLLPHRYWRYIPLLRTPRFRRKKRQTGPLPTSFRGRLVATKNSKVTRFVDDAGWLPRRFPLPLPSLEVAPPGALQQAIDIPNIQRGIDKRRQAYLIRAQRQTEMPAARARSTVVMPTDSVPTDIPAEPSVLPETIAAVPVGAQTRIETVQPSAITALSARKSTKAFRFDRRTSGFSCEQLALRSAKRGEIVEAVRILWAAILVDTFAALSGRAPNYRLYDLLTGVAHRGDLKLDSADINLPECVKANWPNDRRLGWIVARLSTPPSSWSKQWKQTKLIWPKPTPVGQHPRKRHRVRKRALRHRHIGEYPVDGRSVF